MVQKPLQNPGATQRSLASFFSPVDTKGKGRAKRRISDDSIQLLDERPKGEANGNVKRAKLEINGHVEDDEDEDLEQVVIPASDEVNHIKPEKENSNGGGFIVDDHADEIKLVSAPHAPDETKLPELDLDYPPPNHPSYHLPPSPSYNHPISIAPIPASLNLKFNTAAKSIFKAEFGLDLLYLKRFIDPSCSRQLTKYLLDTLPWYRVKYTVRGIDINTPRWTTVFGKDSTSTPWNGYDKASPKAIPPILLKLMQRVEQVTGETYNLVLVNYYASGADSISYHSDSESFLGRNPCIASMSLGASRDFLMRHMNYKVNNQNEKFALQDGDMIVMRGRTQHDWQHSIPKRKTAQGRINITFRKGVVKYATQNYNDYNVGKGSMYRWERGQMVEKK